MIAVWWLACASWVGLAVIDDLPADFPLDLPGQAGQITKSSSGRIAVDRVFEDEAAARSAYEAIVAAGEAQGFTAQRAANRGNRGKREVMSLAGPHGSQIAVECCAQRADRRWLVLVSWDPPL